MFHPKKYVGRNPHFKYFTAGNMTLKSINTGQNMILPIINIGITAENIRTLGSSL